MSPYLDILCASSGNKNNSQFKQNNQFRWQFYLKITMIMNVCQSRRNVTCSPCALITTASILTSGLWSLAMFIVLILAYILRVLALESGYLMTLYSCDDCQRRVPISCVRRQASDPWLTLTTVGESGDGALPGPLPDVGSSAM